MMIYKSLQN